MVNEGSLDQIVDTLSLEIDLFVDAWRTECASDSLLEDRDPSGDRPLAEAVLAALRAPQPIVDGPDDNLRRAVIDYAILPGTLDRAIHEVLHLFQALDRALVDRMSQEDVPELHTRLRNVAVWVTLVIAGSFSATTRREAQRDTLTALFTRPALEDDLANLVEADADRFALAFIDMDGLKQVNDADGHEAGNQAIRAVAGSIDESLDGAGQAYRWGGDEFVVLLPHLESDAAIRVMEHTAEKSPRLISWGLASYPEDATDPAALIRVADQRMYAMKSEHKARDVPS